MSDRSPIANTLRLDLYTVEDTGHHGRIDNPPPADGPFEHGTIPGHVPLGLTNGWPVLNGLAIDHLPTERGPMGMTNGMPFDVYPPHLDASTNSFGDGFDPLGARSEDSFGMGHLRGPNPLDAFSLPQPPLSSSGESVPSTLSALTLRDGQIPGLKPEMTPATTLEPHTLPNAGVPVHLPMSGALMAELDLSGPEWQSDANQLPFFDQPATFGVVQQLPHLAFPPDYGMEVLSLSKPNDVVLGQLQLPGAAQMGVPTVRQNTINIPAPPPMNQHAPPVNVPDTVKNHATPIHVAMRSLDQVASLAATHLPPLPKARGKRRQNRRGVVGPKTAQSTTQRARPKRSASTGRAAPKPTKANGRKAGSNRTKKTKSSLSAATRATRLTKSTNSTYVKPCSPKSQHQCRFDGCTTRCYDKRTLQRHERTHYRADVDTYFCPGVYISCKCNDPNTGADIDIETCTCPPWGYSREDALLRHLRYVLGKEWEGYDDPCVQAAMIMGWDPEMKGSVQRLRPYKPQPPED